MERALVPLHQVTVRHYQLFPLPTTYEQTLPSANLRARPQAHRLALPFYRKVGSAVQVLVVEALAQLLKRRTFLI